jgi:uncharacterized protein YgfB (UPF0149 family)
MLGMSPAPDLAPLVGCVVGRLALDFQVTLYLASQDDVYAQRVDALLVVESNFNVTHRGDHSGVSPGEQLNYAALLPLLHQTIRRAAVDDDGSLALSLTDDLEVRVPRDDHYESWSLSGAGVTGWIEGPG